MDKLTALLKLIRIEHSFMLAIAVVAAELLSGGLPNATIIALSLITPIFISAGSFAINDYFDVKVDKKNKKDRPLVNGSLKPQDALYTTIICMIIGIGSSYFINFNCFEIAVLFAALAILYSYKLKETFLIGNIYIAFSMAIPFIFGDLVVNPIITNTIVLIAVMVFLSGLAREIHGTIRDQVGDKARKVESLPKIVGVQIASGTALAFYVVAIWISAFLFLFIRPFHFNILFGLPIFVSDVFLLYPAFGFTFIKKKDFYNKSRNISLFAMALAIVAIFISTMAYIRI